MKADIIEHLGIKKALTIQALIKYMGNVTLTCEEVGIARSTFYEWSKETEFIEAIAEAQQSKLDYLEANLIKRIEKESDACLIFALKTQGKERGYVEGNALSGININNMGNVTFKIVYPDNSGVDLDAMKPDGISD